MQNFQYITERHYGFDVKFRKPSYDTYVGGEVFYSDFYAIDKIFNIRDNPLVIDLGAHIGLFCLKVMFLHKNARIFAYEPVNSNFELLMENIEMNQLSKNVNIFNMAVSGKSEKRKINISKINSAGHSMLIAEDQSEQIVVNCTTLEKIFLDNAINSVDILKIDVEGAEYDILYSTPPSLFVNIKNIILEYHEYEGNTVFELIIFLQNNGFKLIRQKNGGKSYTGMLYLTRF